MLRAVFEFRSKGRIPVMTWQHPFNGTSLSRCSQPLSGIRQTRCPEDEALIRYFFFFLFLFVNTLYNREMGFANQPLVVDKLYVEFSLTNFLSFYPFHFSLFFFRFTYPLFFFHPSEKNLYVLDCRPKVNAMGNRAKGAGYEDTTTSYPNCILEFLNIGTWVNEIE